MLLTTRKAVILSCVLSEKEKYASLFGCRKNEVMVVIPAHKPIGKGMLRTIIKEIDLSVEEFNKLL